MLMNNKGKHMVLLHNLSRFGPWESWDHWSRLTIYTIKGHVCARNNNMEDHDIYGCLQRFSYLGRLALDSTFWFNTGQYACLVDKFHDFIFLWLVL